MDFIILCGFLFNYNFTPEVMTLNRNSTEIKVKNQIIRNLSRYNIPVVEKDALVLAKKISKVSKKYSLNPRLYTAILMRESHYKVSAAGSCSKGRVPADRDKTLNCKDFGMSQINHVTAKAMGFDLNRLMSDVDYALDAGAQVLSDFKKRFSKTEPTWWTRYNTSNPDKRLIYLRLVEKYL